MVHIDIHKTGMEWTANASLYSNMSWWLDGQYIDAVLEKACLSPVPIYLNKLIVIEVCIKKGKLHWVISYIFVTKSETQIWPRIEILYLYLI